MEPHQPPVQDKRQLWAWHPVQHGLPRRLCTFLCQHGHCGYRHALSAAPCVSGCHCLYVCGQLEICARSVPAVLDSHQAMVNPAPEHISLGMMNLNRRSTRQDRASIPADASRHPCPKERQPRPSALPQPWQPGIRQAFAPEQLTRP